MSGMKKGEGGKLGESILNLPWKCIFMLYRTTRKVLYILLEREFILVTVPSDDYTRNHGCANYPDRDGSFPCGRYAAKQYLVISIKGAVQRS